MERGPKEQYVGKSAPLEGDEVVVIVPKGQREMIHIEEMDPAEVTSQITVRVSRNRKPNTVPVVGVIIK